MPKSYVLTYHKLEDRHGTQPPVGEMGDIHSFHLLSAVLSTRSIEEPRSDVWGNPCILECVKKIG